MTETPAGDGTHIELDQPEGEGSTYMELDQPEGEGSTYMELDSPEGSTSIGEAESTAHAAQVAAHDLPIEHDHLGDALAAGLLTAPAAGLQALAEGGSVLAAEGVHAAEEAAAAGIEKVVEAVKGESGDQAGPVSGETVGGTAEGGESSEQAGPESADAGIPAGTSEQATDLGEVDDAVFETTLDAGTDEVTVDAGTDEATVDEATAAMPVYDDGSGSPGEVVPN
jgi:hypothetical protein